MIRRTHLLLTCFCLTALTIFSGCGQSPGNAGVDASGFRKARPAAGQIKEGAADVAALPESKELSADSSNWPTWRGPNGDNKAIEQSPPTSWNESENVVWKVKVPGRGHSSPTIVNGRIFLTTADKQAQTQSLLCYEQKSGQLLWNKVVHEGGLSESLHGNNSYASSTVASDGNHVFCMFDNQSKVKLTCYDLDGNKGWEKSLGTFICDYGFGFGASPICWNGRLFVSSECKTDPFICALNPKDGAEIWRTARPAYTSFSTPIVGKVAGKDQLLMCGGTTVKGYDPESGKELWSAPARWQVSCGTVVWDKDMVFASGGFPAPQTLGVKADGSAKVVWNTPKKCYEQSLLAHDGFVYGLTDNGICYCWDAQTGNVKWQSRMKPKVSASPVLAGDHIYFLTENSTMFVIKANPAKYELVSEIQIGNSAFATPTFVDNKIFMRFAEQEAGGRQEFLACIGETK